MPISTLHSRNAHFHHLCYTTLYRKTYFQAHSFPSFYRNTHFHAHFLQCTQGKQMFIHLLPSLNSTETNISMTTDIQHSTETHDHMHNKYCTPQNHTFTCSLLSYTLEKHTFIWPLLSLHSTETHIDMTTAKLHSTHKTSYAYFYPAFQKNH